jgi:hypothetical protein
MREYPRAKRKGGILQKISPSLVFRKKALSS